MEPLWDVKLIYVPNGAPLPEECRLNRRRQAVERTQEQILALRKKYYEVRKRKMERVLEITPLEKEYDDHMEAYKKALQIIEKAHQDWLEEYKIRSRTS